MSNLIIVVANITKCALQLVPYHTKDVEFKLNVFSKHFSGMPQFLDEILLNYNQIKARIIRPISFQIVLPKLPLITTVSL